MDIKKSLRRVAFIPLLLFSMASFAPNTYDYKERQEGRVDDEIKRIKMEERINRLLRTIRYIESRDNYTLWGASGEYGAYQFMHSTWRMYSHMYFGRILPMTEANQDKVARAKVEQLVNRGFTNKEIASFWNSGKREYKGRRGINSQGVAYDVPRHVERFVTAYNSL